MRQLKIQADRLTNRTENITRYFNDVSSIPILGPDEEFEVGMRAAKGDQEAIEKLISANLRFVVSVAKQYSNPEVSLEDLICQGNIGLCDAAKLFDPTRGFKFISFAVWHIRKEILVYLNGHTKIVRVPQNIISDMSKIRRADELILQEEERHGTIEELEKMIATFSTSPREMTADRIQKTVQADSRSVALDLGGVDDLTSPIEWLTSGSTASQLTDESDLSEAVKIALSKLTPVQKDIVIRRIGIGGGEPEAFSTIAKRYDRTPEWARSLYVKSIRIMQLKLIRNTDTKRMLLDQEL